MGKKAYQERLKQIRMDPVDAELYKQFSSSVQKHVKQEFQHLMMNIYLADIAFHSGPNTQSNLEQSTSKK